MQLRKRMVAGPWGVAYWTLDDPDSEASALARGAVAVLHKPLDDAELIEFAREALDQDR
jgi:CheY-like chemotaxis protein